MEKALKTSDRYLTLGTVVKMQQDIGHCPNEKGFCPKKNMQRCPTTLSKKSKTNLSSFS